MRRFVAAAGLIAALGLGAAVRWTLAEQVADLRPRPDALEYEEAARSLLDGEGYSLVVDGGRHPPRYLPGFSLLLVPSVWWADGVHGSGIRTVFACALAGIAAAWALALVAGGPASAAAAGVLVALAPLHVRWSRAVMADVPAATWTTLAVLGGVWCAARATRSRTWLLLGIAVGLGALLRSSCALVALPLVLACLAQGGGSRAVVRRTAVFGAGVAFGLLPMGAYDVLRFGPVLGGGYAHWVLADYFDWRYVLGAPVGGGAGGNLGFYATQLAGFGTLYPLPLAAAIVMGGAIGLRRPGPARLAVVLAFAVGLLLFALYVPFFWQWDRFLLPVLPLAAVVAALGLGDGVPRVLRAGTLVLLAAAVAAGVRAPNAFAPPDWPTGEVAALRAIAGRIEPDAVLIAEGEPLLVPRLFRDGTDQQWIPLAPSDHQLVVRQLRRRPYAPAPPSPWIHPLPDPPADAAALVGLVETMLAAGRPVYFAVLRPPGGENVWRHRRALAERFGLGHAEPGLPVELRRVGR